MNGQMRGTDAMPSAAAGVSSEADAESFAAWASSATSPHATSRRAALVLLLDGAWKVEVSERSLLAACVATVAWLTNSPLSFPYRICDMHIRVRNARSWRRVSRPSHGYPPPYRSPIGYVTCISALGTLAPGGLSRDSRMAHAPTRAHRLFLEHHLEDVTISRSSLRKRSSMASQVPMALQVAMSGLRPCFASVT